MRRPIIALVSLLVAAAGLAWQNQRRLDELEKEHIRLVAQAAGIGTMIEAPGSGLRRTRRPRPDPVAEARRFAAEWLALEEEISPEGYSQSPGPAERQRIIALMDRFMALNREQLRIVIGELDDREEIVGSARGRLVGIAMGRLVENHPQEAVVAMVESPVLMMLSATGTKTLYFAFRTWTAMDPDSSLAWFLNHRDRLADIFADPESLLDLFPAGDRESRLAWLMRPETGDFPARAAALGLVYGMAGHDASLAVELAGEWIHDSGGENPGKTISDVLSRRGQTSEQRHASLAALREWAAADVSRSKIFATTLSELALGEKRTAEVTQEWIGRAGFSPEELAILIADLPARVNPEETERWMDWLAQSLPEDLASKAAGTLFTQWRKSDTTAAGRWLLDAPDGPVRHAAASTYAGLLAARDPQAAIRWALTLPDGEARKRTLRKILQVWPMTNPEDRQAAEAFAAKHGIQ